MTRSCLRQDDREGRQDDGGPACGRMTGEAGRMTGGAKVTIWQHRGWGLAKPATMGQTMK